MLQDKLEKAYREYVIEEVGADIYYDPKEMNKLEISRRYYESINFGKEHCPHKIKTGWNAISGA